MPNINMIQTNQLTKIIGGKELVKDVNIHVRKGEIYGFLGPNGAGKTTVMKMITNLWKPTYGTIELFGKVLTPTSYEVLKRMASIIEFPCFYEHMSGRENLELHCEYMGYHTPGSVENDIIARGELVLNTSDYSVMKNGEKIELTAKEFEILKLFMKNPKKVYTKEQIYSQIWNDAYLGDENAVNVHISRLRNKIEDNPRDPKYVMTVWGIGYKLGEGK